MSRVDVDWSAAETTIPFDPAVTDGFHTTFASWPPPNLRTSGLSCNLFSSINLLSSPTRCRNKLRNRSKLETPTIHLGHARHIERIEIYWNAYDDHARRSRYGLFPDVQLPLEIMTQNGEVVRLFPEKQQTTQIPPRTTMSLIRMGYEHAGSLSVYKVPSRIKFECISLTCQIPSELQEYGLPIRQIKCWGPATQNWPEAMKLLRKRDDDLREYERLQQSNALPPPPLLCPVVYPITTPVLFPGENDVLSWRSNAASFNANSVNHSLERRIREQNKYGNNSLDDEMSVLWRVVLSYLTWEELKEVASHINHDFHTLSLLTWKVDAHSFKKWTNVLDSSTFDDKINVDATATSRWDETENEDPSNVLDGNPMTWWSSKQLDSVILCCTFVISCDLYCCVVVVLFCCFVVLHKLIFFFFVLFFFIFFLFFSSIIFSFFVVDFSPRIIPLRAIAIFWGDDGGRVRPCSGSFEIQILVPRRRHKWWSTKKWKTIYSVNQNNVTLPSGFTQWPEVIGSTTTFVKLDAETACSGIRIVFSKKQRHWNNHAIVGLEAWCNIRSNDC